MTDKEKIRAEIERLIKENNGSPISVCNDILSYIDSLSEEPVSEDLENTANGYAWAHDTIGVNKETFSTKDVPVEKMVRIPIGEGIKTAVLFGAKWAVRQLEKNRLTACDNQTPEEAKREMDFTMSIIEKEHRQPTFDDAIKYGMKVQKKLMMKAAVLETKVIRDSDGDGIDYPFVEWLELEDNEIIDLPDSLGLKEGDRVKLIIVKDEQ